MQTKKSNGQRPEHIKQGWLDLAAAMQYALVQNGCKGFASVTIRLVAHDLDVLLWREPDIKRISPVTITNGGMSKDVAIALHTIMEDE
jgi:hypothetical protein